MRNRHQCSTRNPIASVPAGGLGHAPDEGAGTTAAIQSVSGVSLRGHSSRETTVPDRVRTAAATAAVAAERSISSGSLASTCAHAQLSSSGGSADVGTVRTGAGSASRGGADSALETTTSTSQGSG